MDFLPIKITAKAASEIKYMMANKNVPAEYGLRVGIRGSGCAGVNFVLGFDKEKPTDKVFEIEQIKVLADKKDILYLLDVQIDFEERTDARGFVFNK